MPLLRLLVMRSVLGWNSSARRVEITRTAPVGWKGTSEARPPRWVGRWSQQQFGGGHFLPSAAARVRRQCRGGRGLRAAARALCACGGSRRPSSGYRLQRHCRSRLAYCYSLEAAIGRAVAGWRSMLCDHCERINAQPDRDQPYEQMEIRGIPRSPIGKEMVPLVCVDCGSEWIRTSTEPGGVVSWRLAKVG